MRTLSPFTLICSLLACLFLAFAISSDPAWAEEAPGRQLTASEAQKMLKEEKEEVLILDVRTPGEFAGGHIPGALNLDFFGPRFEMELGRLDENRPVLIYCQTGRRSEAAAGMLQRAGFAKVFDLKNGFNSWRESGLPVEKSPSE